MGGATPPFFILYIMVDFNNVLITNNSIYIDVSIKDMPYFENCYIDRIVVNDIDSYKSSGPNLDKYVYDSGTLSGDKKSYKNYIKNINFYKYKDNISENLYVVWVKTKGIPAADTPCGEDKEWYSIGIIDYKYLYENAMAYVRELTECKCAKPENFIDFILKTKAIEMMLLNEEYTNAIDFFKKYFRFKFSCKESLSPCNTCHCNG